MTLGAQSYWRTGKLVLKGIGTCIPGVAQYCGKGSGGTNSARYCYAVWLRHLILAQRNGLCVEAPHTLLELGPGDSLGIGLAALLTGSERYWALDVIQHATLQANLAVLDELAQLFRQEADIPGPAEFPRLRPLLDSYQFPTALLPKEGMRKLLDTGRIQRVKQSLAAPDAAGGMIQYRVGRLQDGVLPSQCADMVLSQAVLEYVDSVPEVHRLSYDWLRPGGFVSHQIDLGSHGLAEQWDGHWAYPEALWKCIRGRHSWFINRAPHSAHIRALEQAGFHVVCDQTLPGKAHEELRLAPEFAALSEKDRTTSGAFIQAAKRP